ncbi:Non-structural maintenance of chromosomes element 4 homolog A [Linum grandiflorum]
MRTLKRDRTTAGGGGGGGGEERNIKKERVQANLREEDEEFEQGVDERRILRSKYRALQSRINEEREDLTNVDSDKFRSFMKEVDDLHQHVQKPREQVADAEALLGLTTSLVSCVKSQSTDGVTVGGFIAQLRNAFGQPATGLDDQENVPISVNWKEIGVFVSPIFKNCKGFTTMLGPMDTEIKPRKQTVVTRRTRTNPGLSTRPEEVNNAGAEERTDTDRNMATMFGILRRKKRVKLESLILNRRSFAQTVENLFALSFLVKDGRVEIVVDDNNTHFVLPRNAPAADSVVSKEVAYRHFVFRFDFRDWQSMLNGVPDGEELMPDRDTETHAAMDPGATSSQGAQPQAAMDPGATSSQGAQPRAAMDPGATSTEAAQPRAAMDPQGAQPRTPIRKLTRNRGFVVQNETVEETPEEEEEDEDEGLLRRNGISRCKRRLV